MGEPRTEKITKWEQYSAIISSDRFRSWAFRGQRDASWKLNTSIARCLKDYGVRADLWSAQEGRVVRIFKRKAHLYLDHVPQFEDAFEWLALMQHHGAPTRLLDFTWSPYVAAFFALEQAKLDGQAAVWAVFPPKLSELADRKLGRFPGTLEHNAFNFRGVGNYEKYFLPNKHSFALIGEPFVMNKRLTVQEGTFVVPGIINKPVDEILLKQPDPDAILAKFVFDTKLVRKDAMRHLYNMNITYANLFPDLDGLARSMAYELEFHWAFDTTTGTPTPGFK